MKPRTGLVLGARYELTERIAIGGMGEVWQALDRRTCRTVAAKVLRAELAGEELYLGRLRTEARNSAGLRHPNLATLLDHGEQEGSGYLVMELVPGETLAARLERENRLRPLELLPILVQACRGLHAVHTSGVVHRDVKPANLIITPEDQVKLTDFGISLGSNQPPMTAAGMVMGTAQYLPPEQAMGRAATPAGDVYALGVVAYECLAGRRPYTGATQVDIAFAHVNTPLPPLPGSVPAPLRGVVERMLAKDPARRPASARACARELEEAWEQLAAARAGSGAPGRRSIHRAAPARARHAAPTAATTVGPRADAPVTLSAPDLEPADGALAGASHRPAVVAGTPTDAHGPAAVVTELPVARRRRELRAAPAAGHRAAPASVSPAAPGPSAATPVPVSPAAPGPSAAAVVVPTADAARAPTALAPAPRARRSASSPLPATAVPARAGRPTPAPVASTPASRDRRSPAAPSPVAGSPAPVLVRERPAVRRRAGTAGGRTRAVPDQALARGSAKRPPIRLPRWAELAADRVWLATMTVVLLVLVLLLGVALGSLGGTDSSSAGRGPAVTHPSTEVKDD
ncbi:protein kinase [Georgenia sp. AZ-5]|uniref:serine/threonine-protein kinase n=1 Tax=Georgenia sp. AZ-5 TaxID=3367526 RepID=UPI003754F940